MIPFFELPVDFRINSSFFGDEAVATPHVENLLFYAIYVVKHDFYVLPAIMISEEKLRLQSTIYSTKESKWRQREIY